MGAPNERSGFAGYLQERAREALTRGELSAARAALRLLRTTDFAYGAAAAETLLAVVRDSRSTAEEIEAAAAALIALEIAPDAPSIEN